MPRKANPNSYRERQYSIPEEDVQQLVLRAQANDQWAQSELLKIFQNFLAIYINLLYDGKVNFNNLDTRRFLALFIKDWNVRQYLLRNKLNEAGKHEVFEALRGITIMIHRYADKEDVEQTVNIAFLECIDLYKPRTNDNGLVPFSGYVYAYFYFMLKKRVEIYLIDQLGRKTFPLISDEAEDSEDAPVGFVAPSGPGLEAYLGREEIDENWVWGEHADGIFAILTPSERQLLKWRYVDRMRASEIAAKLMEHSNTTREKITHIKTKLMHYLEDHPYDYDF